MGRMRFLVLAMLVGCSSSEPSAPVVDSSADTSPIADAGCAAPRGFFWLTPGCTAAPECLDPQDTGCVTVVCGCDNKVHVYGCTGAEAPFLAVASGRASEGDPCGPGGVIDVGGD